MQYWEVVTRSFRISWNHKYLWLIALFAGEGGGGGSYGGPQGTSTSSQQPFSGSIDFASVQHQVTTWLSDHIALIVLVVTVWLLLLIAFFVLAAVCEGATVRASAEHDAERHFGLRLAWRSGVATMWVIVRFRLLIIALGLPLTILVIGLVAGIGLAVLNRNPGAAVGLVLLGFLIVVLGIPYAIYLSFLDRLGTRAVVLEQLAARASIARAHRLLFKRLGRTLLVWLISIAVAIVISIALACVLGILFLPFFIIGAAAFSSGSAAAWPVVVLAVLILLPISLIVAGFFSAQGSTYWTLAFRRLDLDLPPPNYYQYQQPPQAPQVSS